jgi:dedicated sortase system histidine kinase
MRFRFSLRVKVVLVALVLAVIPWVGYLHVKRMEELLRDGQEQLLAATSRAIATALADRPELLDLRPGARATGELDLILKSLSHAESRVWIVDQRQRLLVLAGELRKPGEEFDDALPMAEIANGVVAVSALQGVPARRWRETPDQRAVILSASHPVWAGDKVVAAVVAEQTTNAIRSVYNRSLEQLVIATVVAFGIGALVLLLFASRITVRLRRLRDEAEAAIDSQGRVHALIAGSRANDEIGDLSRSFSTVLERLAQYNHYLESMGGRLSHELRTPIAVVRSSLENLKMHQVPDEANVYLARANDGLRRLDTLLTRMSEATRLEQSVREATRERFDAREVVRGCGQGYTNIYPARRFEVSLAEKPVWLRGSPDLYAQMLDKLAANAADFAVGDEPIRIRLDVHGSSSILTVSNRGPRLPESMHGKLFESMVSVREANGVAEPHLGLGLYIVRLIAEFHGGAAQALDREDGSGVVVKVTCPLAS